jgi:hypothetical protein
MATPDRWPKAWRGTWRAEDGKTVEIAIKRRDVRVTVRPAPDASPYVTAELLGGGRNTVEELVATCFVDDDGRKYLEVEAGTDELGPTYRLYAATEQGDTRRAAPESAPPSEVVLVPNTSIGLYDDWEDDQGVPWAFPLEPMRFVDG